MISKKYLGLFAIICTTGITSLGVSDVDATMIDLELTHDEWLMCLLYFGEPLNYPFCGWEPYDPRCVFYESEYPFNCGKYEP